MNPARLLVVVAALFFAGLVHDAAHAAAPVSAPQQKVRVQLKWFHQYQFAGFYAALEKGYFARAGLDVELIEGSPLIDPAEVVARGDAEFGVGNSSLLIDFNAGRPVMAVAAIFQHSPFVILTRLDPDIRSVRDLEGRTLMGETHSAELTAYLKKAGVDLDRVRLVPHTGTVRSLVESGAGRVDATTAYISTEPFEASHHRIAYQIFNPRDLNIDFYGDTLFTSQRFAREHPEAVTAMRDALIEGWRHANTHQAEMIELILTRYSPQMDRLALSLEAQAIYNLFQADVVDIGYMSRTRWNSIGEVFADTGLLPKKFSLDGFLFAREETLPRWVYQAFAWGLLALALAAVLATYIVSLNRRLLTSLKLLGEKTHALELANAELARLSTTDALTGLFNRRHFDEALESELARARRSGQPLALLFIDVDEFKRYNDALGHPAGDACLQKVADVLRRNVQRAGEFAARIGGEEFAIVASNHDSAAALALAERIRIEIEHLDLPHPGAERGHVTISIGVVAGEPVSPDQSPATLVAQADAALYEAKRQGRNCCVSSR